MINTYPIGVLERIERLVKVGGRRTDTADHESLRIATQRVLNKQFHVMAIRHKYTTVYEGVFGNFIIPVSTKLMSLVCVAHAVQC